jgi:quinol-cytochrome oxidoreductase complex cytochrome b subunit
LKKYLWFVGVFVVAFVVLQLAAGLIMTMLYTPSFLLEGGTSLQSEVVFGEASLIPPVVLALLALGAAYFTTRLVAKKRLLNS